MSPTYLRPMYTNKIKIRGQAIARQILDFFPHEQHAYKLEEFKEEKYTDTNNLSFNNYRDNCQKKIFTNKFIIRFDGEQFPIY